MTTTPEKAPIALNLICSLFLVGSFYIVISCGGDATPAEEDMAMTAMMPLDVGIVEDAFSSDVAIEIDMEGSDSGTDAASETTDIGRGDLGPSDDATITDMGSANSSCEGRVINTDEELALYSDCEEIVGDLILIETSISDLSPLSRVRRITGQLLLRDNEMLSDLSPLSSLTSLGGLSLDSNDAMVNLSGLTSITEVTGHLAITWNDALRDISGLNQLEVVTGTLDMYSNPVLCQAMVNHFVSPIATRNPELTVQETSMNGFQELSCDPLCPSNCADGDICVGTFEFEPSRCLDLCRDETDCSSSAFCRPDPECRPVPGCQTGQPCESICAQVCIAPDFCEDDSGCRESYYCDLMCAECNGICVPQCTQVEDCSMRQTCTNGRCVSTCVPGTCRDGETCLTDTNNPQGVCIEGCYATEDCGPDSICIDGDRATSQLGQCAFTEAVTGCAAPRQIGNGRYAGDTQGQSGLIAGSCGNRSSDVPEAVFEYRTTENGLICVDTYGSNFDTVLSIRTGACEGTECSEIACNDDAGQVTSALKFQATPTESYFIVVDGYNSGGRFKLNIAPCDASETTVTPTSQTCN